ncbi:hypothetical protein C0585_06655 [Candidatus Woesearchaeota archaeon]|nr:MAG: hypothetical protein C0585_06655 [Candidatus Woesearchaeota archaeon]
MQPITQLIETAKHLFGSGHDSKEILQLEDDIAHMKSAYEKTNSHEARRAQALVQIAEDELIFKKRNFLASKGKKYNGLETVLKMYDLGNLRGVQDLLSINPEVFHLGTRRNFDLYSIVAKESPHFLENLAKMASVEDSALIMGIDTGFGNRKEEIENEGYEISARDEIFLSSREYENVDNSLGYAFCSLKKVKGTFDYNSNSLVLLGKKEDLTDELLSDHIALRWTDKEIENVSFDRFLGEEKWITPPSIEEEKAIIQMTEAYTVHLLQNGYKGERRDPFQSMMDGAFGIRKYNPPSVSKEGTYGIRLDDVKDFIETIHLTNKVVDHLKRYDAI